MVTKRFEVYLVNLDPTVGSEIKKMRPCLIISPDEMNTHITTVIVAPMTTQGRAYPTRVSCKAFSRAWLPRDTTSPRSRSVKSASGSPDKWPGSTAG